MPHKHARSELRNSAWNDDSEVAIVDTRQPGSIRQKLVNPATVHGMLRLQLLLKLLMILLVNVSSRALSRLISNVVERGRQTLRNRGDDLMLDDVESTFIAAEEILFHY